MATRSIQLNTIGRILMIAAAIFCVLAAYFVARWGFGHTIAQHTNIKEIAEFSTELAPYDSETYYRLGLLNEKSFLVDDWTKSLQDYEKAISVAPNDFRLWLALGKARERTGDGDGAEKALRKALELAPNYSEVHWVFGNTLLRQGKADEAFVEIRKAVENDPLYGNPAVITAWQTFDGDVAQISQKIGDSIPIKAGLASFLAKEQKFDEAFAFWNTVPEKERSTTYKKSGEEFVTRLLEAKRFRDALTVQTQIVDAEAEKFTVGKIFNGDFEKDGGWNTSVFNWRIADGSQPQIGLDDGQKHGGNRSLVIVFNSNTGQEFRPIQQTIAVEGGKNYKLEVFYRSELKGLLSVKWEIADANDGKVLAATDAAGPAVSDWGALSAGFTTLPATQAVIIRLAPVACKQSICPIAGNIWFDDISLK
jgi:tetratricopeptide (TPR) repeat protein